VGSRVLARWTVFCSGSSSRESHARSEEQMQLEHIKLLQETVVRCLLEWGELISSHRRPEHRPEELFPVMGQIQRTRGFLIEPLSQCSPGVPSISSSRIFEAKCGHRSHGVLKARTLDPYPAGSEEVKPHSRRACKSDNRSACKRQIAIDQAKYDYLQSATWFLRRARGAGESPH
jgi:hypothetical protein